MSDTDFGSIMHRYVDQSIVDEAWQKDSLSDDDIDVPKEVLLDEMSGEDDDEEEELRGDPLPNSHDVWGDLGLDRFLRELSLLNAAVDPQILTRGGETVARQQQPPAPSATAAATSQ